MMAVRRVVRKGWVAAGLSLFAWGAGGCGGDDSSRVAGDAGFTVTDSAGIRLAQNTWSEDAEVPEWRLEPEPIYSVGFPAPSPEYELFGVGSVRSVPGGGVVMTVGAEEVRVFGADGQHVVTFGRRGEGPGEFALLTDAHPLGDTAIQTFDTRLQRVSLFDAVTGELLESHDPEPFFFGPNGVAPLRDGSFVGLALPADPELEDLGRLVIRWGPGGSPVDTLGRLSRPARRADESENVRPWFFGRFWSAARAERVWAGFGARLDVRQYHRDGTLERIVRSNMPGMEVDEEMRATAPDAPPGYRYDVPDRLPLFGKLLASPSGWLWVRHYLSNLDQGRLEDRPWDVYDPEGRHAARIRIPMNATLGEVGDDYVLGVFPNELDVEVVAKYRIVRPEGG